MILWYDHLYTKIRFPKAKQIIFAALAFFFNWKAKKCVIY